MPEDDNKRSKFLDPPDLKFKSSDNTVDSGCRESDRESINASCEEHNVDKALLPSEHVSASRNSAPLPADFTPQLLPGGFWLPFIMVFILFMSTYVYNLRNDSVIALSYLAGDHSKQYYAANIDRANFLNSINLNESASSLLKDTIARAVSVKGEEDEVTILAKANLARIYWNSAKLDESKKLLNQIAKTPGLERIFTDPSIPSIMLEVGYKMEDRNMLRDSPAILQAASRGLERFPQTQIDGLWARYIAAYNLNNQSKFAESQKELEPVIEQLHSTNRQRWRMGVEKLAANNLFHLNRYSEAAEFAKQAAQRGLNHYKARNYEVMHAEIEFARALTHQGKLKEAEELLLDLRKELKNMKDSEWYYGFATRVLEKNYSLQGREEEAQKMHQEHKRY